MGTDNQRTIEEWSEQLHHHFRTLQESRKGDEQRKVFALEHGLDEAERRELSATVNQTPIGPAIERRGWLPLVVHAAEVGYTYDGNEYWQSFEEKTHGWSGNKRSLLRRCFEKFADTYGGVTPTGKWAEHFRIIAWPITHAIIPKYIQEQFVDALFDLCDYFAVAKYLSVEDIGNTIERRTLVSSDRLKQFLQQTELTGRLVLALLPDRLLGESNLILDQAMERVVADLHKEPGRRTKLTELRHRIKLVRRTGTYPQCDDVIVSPQFSGRYAGLSPLVQLRYDEIEKVWEAFVRFTPYKGSSNGDDAVMELLKNSRCQVYGSERYLPKGWLLGWNPQTQIRTWPALGQPALSFLDDESGAGKRIQRDSEFELKRPWLFKVGGDGIARDISQKFVRPGARYVLLRLSGEEIASNPMVSNCTVDCDGISAVMIEVPGVVSDEDRAWLHSVDLGVAGTVTVWPAGLVCLGWDGEGSCRWWTTDEPCFGLQSDHHTKVIYVSLNGESEVPIDMQSDGNPSFIRLPQLSAGDHELMVRSESPERGLETGAFRSAVQRILVKVEVPLSLRDNMSRSAVRIQVEPYDASLEQLWQGRVAFTIDGPSDVPVDVKVMARNSKGCKIGEYSFWVRGSLPITPSDWRGRLMAHVEDDTHVSEYLLASEFEVEVSTGEFGYFSRTFYRESSPLRWVPRQLDDGIQVKLVNDLDNDDGKAVIRKYCMKRPTVPIAQEVREAMDWMDTEPPGALYVAQHGDNADSAVIDPSMVYRDFDNLSIDPEIARVGKTVRELDRCLMVLGQWDSARLYGGRFVGLKVDRIVRAIWHTVYRSLDCGSWAESEARVAEDRGNPIAHAALIRLISETEVGLGEYLWQACGNRAHDPHGLADDYARVMNSSGICANVDVANAVFWLGASPSRVSLLPENSRLSAVRSILSKPMMLLSSRLLALYGAVQRENTRRA